MKERVIFFDGVCNLCNNAVQFIIKRDRSKKFKFASLQSEFAQKELVKRGFNPQPLLTIVLLSGQSIYTKSDAALKIARHLNKGWPLLYIFIIIPRFLRNVIYDFISLNRYKWFGKRNQCMIPSPDLESRFPYEYYDSV